MRIDWLVGTLTLTLSLLISYLVTLYFFAPLFGEQVDLVTFNKLIIGVYIPHYIVVILFFIISLDVISFNIKEELLGGLSVYFILFAFISFLIIVEYFSFPISSIISVFLSFAGVAASIYFGRELGREVEEKRRKNEKKIKIKRINERTFLMIKNSKKLVKKCFKGFSEDILDDVISGVSNWFQLREVKGVQQLVAFNVRDMCVFAEYIEGENLRTLLRDSALSERDAVDICLKIAMVLEKVLNRNIVHRDLKPENVIISKSGEITIIDWEFSTRLDTKPPKTVVGTLPYVPPEGIGKLTEKYDIYSLGIMLREMLTGSPYRTTFILKNEDLKKLVENMTYHEPERRVSLDKVIESLRRIKKVER
jgi:serine/threonine protein kinase